MVEMYEIRCPGNREHTVNNGDEQVAFETCGSLMGGIAEDSTDIQRCPICKRFWQVSFNGADGLTMTAIKKGTHLNLKRCVRRIIDETINE